MRFLLLVFSTLFFMGCRQTAERIPEDCARTLSVLDSAKIADLEMDFQHASSTNIVAVDTAYRFRAASGWGLFEVCCSIYADSSGYHASSQDSYDARDGVFYSQRTTPLSRLQWVDFQQKIAQSGFWCLNPTRIQGCFDATRYKIWAKEGKQHKLIQWDECVKMNDSIWILVTQMQHTCNNALNLVAPAAVYAVKGDSIFVRVIAGFSRVIPVASAYIEIGGEKTPATFRDGIAYFTIPKDQDFKLHRMCVVDLYLDQSVQKVLVKDIKKVPFREI